MLTPKFEFAEAKEIDIAQLIRLTEFLQEVSDLKLDFKFCTYMKSSLAHKGIAQLELELPNRYAVYSTVLTLLGPLGILPPYYRQHVIKHMKDHETTLMDFLEVFYNRMLQSLHLMLKGSDLILTLRKYALTAGRQVPLLIKCLSAFSGICHGKDTLSLSAILHCTGVMISSRPACSLHRLLSSFLRMPVVIEQFKLLKWPLESNQKTLLAKHNSVMNLSFYLGHHAYLHQNLVSIKILDLDLGTFRALMNQKKDLSSPLNTLLRAYLGKAIKCTLKLEAKEEAKPTQISCSHPAALGFDMWCSNYRAL